MPQKALASKGRKPEKLGKKAPRVNAKEAARRATQSGGKMLVVKPPPDAQVEIRGPKPKMNRKQAPVVKVPYRF